MYVLLLWKLQRIKENTYQYMLSSFKYSWVYHLHQVELFTCWKYVMVRIRETSTKYVFLHRLMTWISVSTHAWHYWEVTKKMTVPQSWWPTCHTDEMSMIQLCSTSSSYLVGSSCSLSTSLEMDCFLAYFSLHNSSSSATASAVTNGK